MMTLLLLMLGAVPPDSVPRVRIEMAISASGEASDRWLAMIRRRVTASMYDSIAAISRPLGPEERAWSELILARQERWQAELPALIALFIPAEPPKEAVLLLGNRGGEDAFVHDRTSIGFDLAALQRVYGDAEDPENAARVDRLFRHEYVHLLQKAWLAERPYRTDTPLRAAVAEIWAEGMGTWFSMSERWRAREGRESEAAAGALAELAPRFVERMVALTCASPEEAERLTADLGYGPFEEKWGALPAALWIEAQASREGADLVLRRLLLEGPEGVWDLAGRHLPPAARERLDRARATDREDC